MDLIPAIDLLDGVAVRLVQGDYDRRVAEHDDVEPMVRSWVARGVRWLHLVDLEGARSGYPVHLELAAHLGRTARDVDGEVRTELGGGIRTEADVAAALAEGIDVAILGTAAVEDPMLVERCASRWPGRVAVSLDLRDGRAALDGWLRTDAADPIGLARRFVAAGAAHLIVTDVTRDGTKSGPNLALLETLRTAVPDARLVAAGGIGSAGDLRALAAAGMDGAVVGLALIDGSLEIDSALAAARTG